jgi:Flp pilus assembly protein TadG
MSIAYHQHRKWRGIAAVEFALVLPVLLTIIMIIINWGVVIYNQSVITNAAREGARWAAIHNTSTTTCTNAYAATPIDACQVAYSYAFNHVYSFVGGPTLAVTQASTAVTTGAPQTVTVQYTYGGVATYFSGANPNKTYTSSAVMLHE